METVTITVNQLSDLIDYTKFNTNICVQDLLQKGTASVEIFETGGITIHHTGHIESHGSDNAPAWDIKGRQDFDLLCRLIDSEFGVEGMSIGEIDNALNDHINTIGATEEYCDYHWSDGNAKYHAEIDGTEYEPFYEDPERTGNWSWDDQECVFRFNVDGDVERSDYDGISPRDAWEAINRQSVS